MQLRNHSVATTMGPRKREDESENSPAPKKMKSDKPNPNLDPRQNPYLSHMYENQNQDEQDGYGNGFGFSSGLNKSNGGTGSGAAFSNFRRHATTAEMAASAEDGPANPFTGNQFSKKYFDILKTRRNLPVHAQR
jgi:pre-mRNA-splicing factor ATP-dependent RNA helicase DHX15/PRP43